MLFVALIQKTDDLWYVMADSQNNVKIYASQNEAYNDVKNEYPSDQIKIAKLQELTQTNDWVDPT